MAQYDLAKMFNTYQGTISAIVNKSKRILNN